MESINKVYVLEDRAYNAEELKNVFDENKNVLTYEDYYNGTHKVSFVLLDQTKPVLINGYPYGRLRTQVKYWIESNNYGECLVFQSQNPKTLVWNKPKKSCYVDLGFMVIDEQGHITTISLNYNDGESKNKAFESLFLQHMSKKQKIIFCKISGYTETMKDVTFSVRARLYKHRETGEIMESVNIFDLNKVDECDENGNLINKVEEEQKEKQYKETINKSINYNARQKAHEIFN